MLLFCYDKVNMKSLKITSTLAIIFLAIFTKVDAYNPILNNITVPYEVQTIDGQIENKVQYLGALEGDPHMYEFSIGADANLVLTISQLENDTPLPFSLIVVKQNDRNAGVVEVGRLKNKDISWLENNDSVLGLSLLNSQVFEAGVTPGLYRFEISTPDNLGSYMLSVGTKNDDVGYFATLSDIHQIQNFFGFSIFSMFLSSYVYYPIGIIIILLLFYKTWRKRNLITKKNA
jgi:hypothetical protein